MNDAFVPVGVDPLWVEFLELVADADDHVGLVESKVDVVMAHEAHRAEGVGMVVGKHTLSVEAGRYGESQELREAEQSGSRATPRRAVAGEDDRSAGPVEHGASASDLRGRRLVGARDVHGKR